MNRAIVGCYEPGAGFSSTTGLLAARLVLALLDTSGEQAMHVPAPNGLPGGYPVIVGGGGVAPALPVDWSLDEGAPRPNGDHFHVYRGTQPNALVSSVPDPWTMTSLDDSTPSSPSLPNVHFYKAFAADICEQEQVPD